MQTSSQKKSWSLRKRLVWWVLMNVSFLVALIGALIAEGDRPFRNRRLLQSVLGFGFFWNVIVASVTVAKGRKPHDRTP